MTWTGIITGDADGDGRIDIIGRVAPSDESARGSLWVGKVGEGGSGLMSTQAWGFVGAPADSEAR